MNEKPIETSSRGSLTSMLGARLSADVVGLVCALGAGVITARLLGPSGKGLYAALILFGIIFAAIGGSSFGEAAVVRVGQRAITLRKALGATVAAIMLSSLVAAVLLLSIGSLAFQAQWATAATAVLVAAAVLPIAIFFDSLQQILNANERIAASSALMAASAVSTTSAMLVLVGPLDLGVAGAIAATGVGPMVGLAGCFVLLERSGLRPFVAWDGDHFRWALKYGAKVQSGYLAGTLSARFDILLVYWIAGAASAGFYSVSLTIGTLVSVVPWAMSYVTFPRLAALSEPEARSLTLDLCRLGVISASLAVVALLLLTPLVVPLAFGDDFKPAVVPALILLPSGIVVSLHTLLTRALAARGEPNALVITATTSLVVMCAIDLLSIPLFGMRGAAVAAAVGPGAGLWAALRHHGKRHAYPIKLRELVPRRSDFSLAVSLMPWHRRRTSTTAIPPTK